MLALRNVHGSWIRRTPHPTMYVRSVRSICLAAFVLDKKPLHLGVRREGTDGLVNRDSTAVEPDDRLAVGEAIPWMKQSRSRPGKQRSICSDDGFRMLLCCWQHWNLRLMYP